MPSDIVRGSAIAHLGPESSSIYQGGAREGRSLRNPADTSCPIGGMDWVDAPPACRWPKPTKSGAMCAAAPMGDDPRGLCVGHGRSADAEARRATTSNETE